MANAALVGWQLTADETAIADSVACAWLMRLSGMKWNGMDSNGERRSERSARNAPTLCGKGIASLQELQAPFFLLTVSNTQTPFPKR